MKKKLVKIICDFCNDLGKERETGDFCELCGKDICLEHSITLFNKNFCPDILIRSY